MTRWAVLVATALIALLVGGALLLGGEAWWAARGPQLPEPATEADDLPAGPPVVGGALAATAGPVAVVVWLGDSTAAGVGASARHATLPEQVAAQGSQPVRLTVLARSGARVAEVLRTQLPQVGRVQPTEVFISVGANDATHLTSRSRFRRDYGRLLAGLPASVTRVVLLGIPDLGGPPRLPQPLRALAGLRGRQLATDLRNLARRRHALYVDIAGGTGAAFRSQPRKYFASDRYHPSDAGYHLWAMVVVAATAAPAPP